MKRRIELFPDKVQVAGNEDSRSILLESEDETYVIAFSTADAKELGDALGKVFVVTAPAAVLNSFK